MFSLDQETPLLLLAQDTPRLSMNVKTVVKGFTPILIYSMTEGSKWCTLTLRYVRIEAKISFLG